MKVGFSYAARGEDFASQMYAIFEEFLQSHLGWNSSGGRQPNTSDVDDLSPGYGPSTRGSFHPQPQPPPAAMHDSFPPEDHLQSSDLENRHHLYNPPPVRERSANKHHHSNPEVCNNPLLETISTIENTCCDSDDYSSVLPGCYSSKTRSQETLPQVNDGDKDTIGYAGSNSIDSGYKSSCPTPELSDGSFYGSDGTKGSGSCLYNRVHDSKPRIAMGTRVMHRQPQQPHQPHSLSQHTSPTDVNLDHFMYLRQTLRQTLSAMQQQQQCAGASETAATVNRNDTAKFHQDESVSERMGNSTQRPPNAMMYSSQYRSRDQLMAAGADSYPRRMPSPTFSSRQMRTPSPRPQRRIRRVSSPSEGTWTHHAPSASQSASENYAFRPYQNRSPNRVDPHSPKPMAVDASWRRSSAPGHPSRSPLSPRSPRSPKSPRNSRTPSPLQTSYHSRLGDSHVVNGGEFLFPPSSLQGPSQYQKTVRFIMDGGESSSAELQATPSDSTKGFSGGGGSGMSTTLANKSKPILKDPICANLRSQLELKPDDDPTAVTTLEEEIDTLLYGRTEYRKAAGGNSTISEYPNSSYVTMIEDKYCKSVSLAKVKKLRDKSHSSSSVPGNDLERGEYPFTMDQPSASSCGAEDEPDLYPHTEEYDIMKIRFSEVAKCMLEIIDLQRQQMTGSGGASASEDVPSPAKELPPGRSFVAQQPVSSVPDLSPCAACSADVSSDGTVDDSVCNYDSRRLGGADYHLYEEIIYNMPVKQRVPSAAARSYSSTPPSTAAQVPPPLPKRPNGGFPPNRGVASRAPAAARIKDDSSTQAFSTFPPHSLRGLMDKGNAVAPCDKPKQRLNLYSIFREQSDRRSISLSLEQDWRTNRDEQDDDDDEYGFKVIPRPT